MDEEALKTACFLVAKTTKWKRKPQGVESIQHLANQFFEIAKDYEEFVCGQGRDPNLITRAVLYLANVHAIPPMQENTEWFKNMMDILIELACPNTQPALENEMFYKDIEAGISNARAGFVELIQA